MGYAFSTGWNNTDSLLSHVCVDKGDHACYAGKKVSGSYLQVTMYRSYSSSIC